MSNTYPASVPGNPDLDTSTASDSGAGPDAKERATEVKDTSVAAGQHVAGVAKDELHKVGSETKQQAKDLYRQTQGELADQAAAQQKRVAAGLRSLGDELGAMADKSDTQGVASDIAHQAASRAAGIADWLDQRDPGALLDEVKGYARRSPGMFIGIAAVAGVVAGRLTRSVIAEAKDSSETASTGSSTPATAPTGVGTEFGTGATTGIDTAFDTPTTPTGTATGVGTPLTAEYPNYTENRND
ncbi:MULTISPECIES: hypothetical protein [Cryobacterium]|uniref:hypothetical protein n=1 Tax=Cryobacterium TaxID=69578 RepID=UPI000B4C2AC0|nr:MULTISPECIES: hypothetical protein [Cryobacterium]ASD21055.1 hypothetical protein B7495_02195 [Cryobacterium sp. LW097]POH63982.1 hypothetical protein C3B60_14605 [Cryobacterium zongtaii]TFC43257.1 hypothetical protein E3O57_13850 [Cryobacterium sp. TMN-39-2]